MRWVTDKLAGVTGVVSWSSRHWPARVDQHGERGERDGRVQRVMGFGSSGKGGGRGVSDRGERR